MGEPFLVQLDESHPGERILICSNCRTQLVLASEFRYLYRLGRSGLPGSVGLIYRNVRIGLLEEKPKNLSQNFLVEKDKVVNVYSEESNGTRNAGPYRIKDIHCCRCSDHLGWKIVQIFAPAEHFEHFQPGDFLIQRGKLRHRE